MVSLIAVLQRSTQQQTGEQNIREPQKNHKIYIYIYFYSHFIYGLIFTRHNLKTERVDGASVTSPGHPPCPLHHRPSSRSTDPLQHAATTRYKNAITTTSIVTCKLCWLLI